MHKKTFLVFKEFALILSKKAALAVAARRCLIRTIMRTPCSVYSAAHAAIRQADNAHQEKDRSKHNLEAQGETVPALLQCMSLFMALFDQCPDASECRLPGYCGSLALCGTATDQATMEDDFRRRLTTGSLAPLAPSINSTAKPFFKRQATRHLWS